MPYERYSAFRHRSQDLKSLPPRTNLPPWGRWRSRPMPVFVAASYLYTKGELGCREKRNQAGKVRSPYCTL
jgi:hypothetical protein